MTLISELMINSGYNAPNTSRLKDKLTSGKNKAFLKSKGNAPTIEFVPAIFQSLEKTIGAFWTDATTIAVSYTHLKLLIDKNMKKKELGEAAGISNTLIAKLGKNENVTVEVLVKICTALDLSLIHI